MGMAGIIGKALQGGVDVGMPFALEKEKAKLQQMRDAALMTNSNSQAVLDREHRAGLVDKEIAEAGKRSAAQIASAEKIAKGRTTSAAEIAAARDKTAVEIEKLRGINSIATMKERVTATAAGKEGAMETAAKFLFKMGFAPSMQEAAIMARSDSRQSLIAKMVADHLDIQAEAYVEPGDTGYQSPEELWTHYNTIWENDDRGIDAPAPSAPKAGEDFMGILTKPEAPRTYTPKLPAGDGVRRG